MASRQSVRAAPSSSVCSDFDSPSPPPPQRCDVCGREIDGEPAGRGLMIWSRGEEVRYEEPPLCVECAPAITRAGFGLWNDGGDEGE